MVALHSPGGHVKLSETAQQVIALGEAIRNYWDTELPKRHPDYPFVHPGEDDGPPPPEEKQLKDLLERLPEDDLYKLALIMHLGQGYFGTEDLASHYQALKERFETPDWAIVHIMTKAPVGDDLTEGLAELKKSGIDVDALTFSFVKSGA
jgi:hypothetical protein